MSYARTMSPLRIALCVAVTIGASTSSASAQAPIFLDWQGECNAAERVRAEVDAIVGPLEAPPLEASVTVRKSARGYSVRIQTNQEGQIGVRHFEAPGCDKLIDATVLILIVLLAPVEAAEVVAPALGAEREASKPAAAARRAETRHRRPQRRATWSFGFGPELGAGLGVLPGPSLFAALELWAAHGGLRLGATGRFWPERTTTDGSSDGVAAISLSTAELRGCAQMTTRAPHVDACVAAETGAYSGRGVGIARPRSASPLWAAAGPGIALRSEGTLSSTFSLYAPVALVRPSFQIRGIGEVFQPPIASVRLAMAIDFNLP